MAKKKFLNKKNRKKGDKFSVNDRLKCLLRLYLYAVGTKISCYSTRKINSLHVYRVAKINENST